MSFPGRYAVLIDGAFLVRKLEGKLLAFPTAAQVAAVAAVISNQGSLAGLSLLRIYFYHSQPATGVLTNPISKRKLNLATTSIFARHESLLHALEILPDFALRLGETSTRGWKLGTKAFENLLRSQRPLQGEDLVPCIEQKGVDLRIGLDIARLALTRSVQAVVAITGDSDLVPAFRFARREGLRVFLCHLDHRIKRSLIAHADGIISLELSAPHSGSSDSIAA